jgi:hypothetical protein
MKSESIVFELYLTLTVIAELFCYLALIYAIYWRKTLKGWVKMQAGLELEKEHKEPE